MKILRISTVLVFLVLFLRESLCQLIPVDQGWSRNSVNTVVFRKNSIVTHENHQYVAYYDSSGYMVLAKRTHGTRKWEFRRTPYTGNVTDAHCSISIMADGAGYLHVAWNHHNSRLSYCRSTEPGSLTLTGPLIMTGRDESGVSYPEFYRFPDGDLFFLYRDGSSGNGNLVINQYLVATREWIRVQDIVIDGEKQRNAYWQAAVDSRGTFHLSWVWRESSDVSTNHDMCYARTTDKGKTWQRSDGSFYDLPITRSSAEYACRIPQNSNLINQTSMYADENGNPCIATYFSREGSPVPQLFLICKDGGEWITRQVTTRSQAFSLKGGGTKKIPLSRPQVLVENNNQSSRTVLIYRDIEYEGKITFALSKNPELTQWDIFTANDFSLESWEPSYDTELWKDQKKLHLYVQKTGQGDAESLENMDPQMIYVFEAVY